MGPCPVCAGRLCRLLEQQHRGIAPTHALLHAAHCSPVMQTFRTSRRRSLKGSLTLPGTLLRVQWRADCRGARATHHERDLRGSDFSLCLMRAFKVASLSRWVLPVPQSIRGGDPARVLECITERTAEHIVDFPVSRTRDDVVRTVRPVLLERINERLAEVGNFSTSEREVLLFLFRVVLLSSILLLFFWERGGGWREEVSARKPRYLVKLPGERRRRILFITRLQEEATREARRENQQREWEGGHPETERERERKGTFCSNVLLQLSGR